MNRVAALGFAFVLAVAPLAVEAAGHGGGHASSSHSYRTHSSSHSSSHSYHSTPHFSSSTRAHATRSHSSGSHRTSHGSTKRDPRQRAAFMHSHPCPSTGKTSGACPGYVVDHVQALKHGGRDDPSNMQWQTASAGKAKDKVE